MAGSIWHKVASSWGRLGVGMKIGCVLAPQTLRALPTPLSTPVSTSPLSMHVQIFLVHYVSNPFEKFKTKV